MGEDVMEGYATEARQGVAFGPFRLLPAERLLGRGDTSVQLGSRALDILMLLIERAGTTVSKDELLARAWPTLTVDEGSLRFQIAALRKALGDGKDGARYITNVPGRGYSFVAPVQRLETPQPAAAAEPAPSPFRVDLPTPLTRMIGREDAVRRISKRLAANRFVTIHGPGGIGKTTVAVAVGHDRLASFGGAVHFIDLAPLSEPRLVPGTLASALGLVVQSSDPVPSLMHFLGDRRMLLILDNCEHVIEAAAVLAERIYQEAPKVSLLTTSREPLRVEGEYVHRLGALAAPPDGTAPTAAELAAFPAANLFMERASAASQNFKLTDADAPVLANICRRLDGIALAIELTAGVAGAFSLREIALLLDSRPKLIWRGRRTAPRRHQTLNATLDWSYELISGVERAVLRRLSVFVASFTLDAARAVAASAEVSEPQVVDAVGQLVAKSLISTSATATTMRYRLNEVTRSYAAEKLAECGETGAAAHRHARHCLDVLQRTDSSAAERSSTYLADVQVALDWCLFTGGDIALGTELAAASAPLFLQASLLSECLRWTEQAVLALDQTTRGTRIEMELQAALGHCLMYTKSNSDEAQAALARALELAEALQDRLNEFRLISRLHMFQRRTGDFSRLLALAQRAETVAAEIADPLGTTAAHSLLGLSHHLLGNQAEARTHLEAALAHPVAIPLSMERFGYHPDRARATLARTRWLQGFPDQAVLTAVATIEEPAAPQDPVTYCIATIFGVVVLQWVGDLTRAEHYIDRVIAHATRYSLAPFLTVGECLKGELLVKRGETASGIKMLRGLLSSLHVERYELYTTGFRATLAEGFRRAGDLDRALVAIEEAIGMAQVNMDFFTMPELMRVRGEVLAAMANIDEAEAAFQQSLGMAEGQSTLAWQLRTVMSLARLRTAQGRNAEARELVAGIYGRFHEGFETADLREAKRLLAP